jgi:DNA ligase-associated metallophosphoesterase
VNVLSIQWAGQDFDLSAARATFWRQARTLIIADPHFGKAAAFRHHGVPVPAGTTQTDVDRLSLLLDVTGATRLIVLGDFLHARDGRAERTMAILEHWRQRHSAIEMILVRGNHDQHAGDPPSNWNIACMAEPFVEGDYAFCHDPDVGAVKSKHVVAGHIHPCAHLHDLDGSRIRAACFLFSKKCAILPAFGTFTGTHPIKPRRGDRVFAIGPDGAVMEIPTAQPAR